ncbi:MAG TPA: CBS domain-containing protein [Solirubrobacteraceae bacterium]|nr:CBS domain-containing protein [Solirubrobacteraceae bacterium]
MTTVAEIMDAEPVTVTTDTSIEELVRVLKEHQLQGVPVVNDGGRCVGMVTEEDLVLSDAEGDLHLPHYIELFGGVIFLDFHHLNPLQRFEERLKKAVASRVEEMMTADPVTIAPTASVSEAARAIAEAGHNRLPVTEHGRLVGLITRVDVLQALSRED